MMPDQTLHQVDTVIWSKRVLFGLFVLAIGVAALSVPAVADDSSSNNASGFDGPEFEETQIVVEPPETAEIDVHIADEERFELSIASVGDERFAVEATINSTEENVTVRLRTENAAADDPATYLSADGGEIRNLTVHSNELDELDRETLPGGMYEMQLTGDHSYHSSTLEVTPSVRFDEPLTLNQSQLETDPIQRIGGETDLEPKTNVTLRLTSSGEEAFLISNRTEIDDDGTFETAVDMGNVPDGARFDVVARHDGIAKGMTRGAVTEPEPDTRASESEGIVLVYEGEVIELEAAPEQRITGEADLDTGETVVVRLQSTGETAFLLSKETHVSEHGTFGVTFDLDEVPPGTEFTAEAFSREGPDVRGSARGVVIDHADDGNTTDVETDTRVANDEGTTGLGDDAIGGLGAIAISAAMAIIGIGLLIGGRNSESP